VHRFRSSISPLVLQQLVRLLSQLNTITRCLDRLLSKVWTTTSNNSYYYFNNSSIDYFKQLVWLLQQLCNYFLNSTTTRLFDRLLQTTWNLHCIKFVRLLQVDQSSMSAPAGNGASGAGPTLGYSLILLYLIKFMLNLNKCTCLVLPHHSYKIINKLYV
jgi:hypothetical protein